MADQVRARGNADLDAAVAGLRGQLSNHPTDRYHNAMFTALLKRLLQTYDFDPANRKQRAALVVLAAALLRLADQAPEADDDA